MAFPSIENIETVNSNLSSVMKDLCEVENHLKAANAVLNKLYNQENQPTQWGAQFNNFWDLEFKFDNLNGHAFLDMLVETQAVKSTVSLDKESL